MSGGSGLELGPCWIIQDKLTIQDIAPCDYSLSGVEGGAATPIHELESRTSILLYSLYSGSALERTSHARGDRQP